MKTLFLYLLTYISFNTFGQNPTKGHFQNEVPTVSEGFIKEIDENGDTILEFEYNANNLSLNSPDKVVKKYKGNPYFGNKLFAGTVTLKGSEPSPGFIGFNVVKGVIYYSPDKNTRAIELTPPRFTLDSLVFQRMDDKVAGAKKYYYNIALEGEPMLLIQHSGSFSNTKDKIEIAYGITPGSKYEGKFVKTEEYFFVINNKLVPVKTKNSFFKSMGPYGHKAKSIVSKQNLDLNKGQDIVKLAMQLNR
ncbi:hypothetical protein SAMN06298216_3449 [Spirosomataceae bacterium TFI 002]|nr:hypothetical protein SAMN06298216_3449 [Spirosomataceae bacterium TFI 002]